MDTTSTTPITIVLVALNRYMNFPIRILHALLESQPGVHPYSIFLKDSQKNEPSSIEQNIFTDLIKTLNPHLIGISVMTPFALTAAKLTKELRKKNDVPVVWGGIHPTVYPEWCMDFTDIICRGEGESPLIDFCNALKQGTHFRSIQNLWVRDNSTIYRNPMRPLIKDIDSLPFPAYNRESFYFIDSNKVDQRDKLFFDKNINILSSRGCPYHCSYCVNGVLHDLYEGLGPKVRRNSVDRIINELKSLVEKAHYKIEHVEFYDEVFGLQKEWLEEFVEKYKNEVDIPFGVTYNPQNLTTKRLSLLKEAGVKTIKFGIQSGADYINTAIFNRTSNNEQIISISKEIASKNIRIYYDLIVDNPYDTEDTLRETILLLLELPRPRIFLLFSLQYFPSYKFTQRAIKDKMINDKDVSIEQISSQTKNNWVWKPSLDFSSRIKMFQNVIYLIVCSRTINIPRSPLAHKKLIKYAITYNTQIAKVLLKYFTCEAVILDIIQNILGDRFRILKKYIRSFLKIGIKRK